MKINDRQDQVMVLIATNFSLIPVMISPYDQEEASLRVICDPDIKDFKYQMVQGLDFSHDNITFDVTSLEISYCPIKSTQVRKLTVKFVL